jgi:hypothetical protein
MSASELLVIQMEFVVKNGEQPRSVILRRPMTSEPHKVVQLCLHEARVLGGIWDLSGKVFYPWHEVNQMTWRPDAATAEDWGHLGFRAAMKHLELTGGAISEDPYRIPEDERIKS